MRKILIIIAFLILLVGCQSEEEKQEQLNHAVYAALHDYYNNTGVSKTPKGPFLYFVPDYGYVTFERYMWDEGFPRTIIVKVTYKGKFQGYYEAERRGVLFDSLGNAYSPAYKIESLHGDTWVYDIKGKFIEFNADIADNTTRDYVPTWEP